jgi:hypothetical protein
VPRIARDEQPGIAVAAVDLTARVTVDAIIEDLGFIENTFSPNFCDFNHRLICAGFSF